MSIINCPHCGRQVTDKAKICIHCGKPIVEEIPEPKNVNYGELSDERRKELCKEFSTECPKYGGVYKKLLIMSKLPLIACVIVVVLAAVMLYLKFVADTYNQGFYLAAFIVMGVILVLLLVWAIIINVYKKQMVYYNKYFKWWLSNKYKIEYSIDYSATKLKYQELFDTIEIDENYFIK
jgi:uncharacterized membrane protein